SFRDANNSLGLGTHPRAHRVSYVLTHGSIPPGISVLHRCDNPPCVNPSHLFLGTPADNYNDMVSKGRDVKLRGEDTSWSTLTEDDVREIRRTYIPRHREFGGRALARKYGVTSGAIYQVIKRSSW